jgi:hypothetical protein
VDLGCPFTSSRGEPISLFGNRVSHPHGFGGLSLDELSEFTGLEVDHILGVDVLGRYPWLLDWQSRKMTIFRKPQRFEGTVVPAWQTEQGHVLVEFEINGEKKTANLDSGAAIQFKPKDYPCGDPIHSYRDFSPLIHDYFDTPIWRTPIVWAGEEFEAEFGLLPNSLTRFVDLMGVEWVLGSDVLKRHPVYFNIPDGKIHVLNTAS